jgi:outer membrane protein
MKSVLAAGLFSMMLAGIAGAEDLLRVYQDALGSDPLIREAEAIRRATRETRPQAWSALLPQVNGGLHSTRIESDETEPTAVQLPGSDGFTIVPVPRTGTTDVEGYTLELRQNIFSWSNWMNLRRAGKEVAQAEADYQAAQQDLVLRVAQRYFAVLSAQNLVEAQAAALEAIARQFDQANKRFEVGLIAVTDVQEAKAARDSASAALIDAKRQLATAQQLLRELTNREYAALARPSETMPLATPQPADMEQWVTLSMDQNLALISSRLAADVARADVNIARGGHFPTIDFVGSRQDNDTDIDTTVADETGSETRSVFSTTGKTDTYGIQVTVPLFSGGFTQSQVRRTQYYWIAAKERMSRVSRETERLARDAFLGVNSEIARVTALKQALESSQTALKATEAGYEVGTRTAVDVLASRQQLVQAQTDYAGSRYDYILNVIQLRLAAGNLDEATVAEINQWLSETAPPVAPAQETTAPAVASPETAAPQTAPNP